MHSATAVRKTFDPRDIPGCHVWLRSDLGITTASGALSVWANQGTVGNAGDATQTSAPARPTYSVSGGLNGRARISFSVSYLDWAYARSGAKTIMVVLKLTSAPGTGSTVYEIYNPASALAAEMLIDLGGYQPVSLIDDWASGFNTGLVGIADALGTSAGHVLTHTFDGVAQLSSSYTASLDGATKTVVDSGTYGSPAAASHIGGRFPSGTFLFTGDLYEILVYNRVLPVSERDQVNSYLKERYAL